MNSKPNRPQHLRIPKLHRDTMVIISPVTLNTSHEVMSTTPMGRWSIWEEEEKDFWTPSPLKFRCRECKIEVISEIIYINGKASLSAGILLLPLAIIPLVVKRWKDVKHRCPSCKMPQGLFKRKIWKSEVIIQTPQD
ncbi:hypothetical protein LOD99_12931 [Oopsacas minuta]|uniref:LITAF domain-containing protein n=1 Tax=Oopsacas minuta TaxID=111878 RepID=A0AAV7J9G9_9METZ|nr:hypothetical protein LOD99_12931 [Oopsacas minuta]